MRLGSCPVNLFAKSGRIPMARGQMIAQDLWILCIPRSRAPARHAQSHCAWKTLRRSLIRAASVLAWRTASFPWSGGFGFLVPTTRSPRSSNGSSNSTSRSAAPPTAPATGGSPPFNKPAAPPSSRWGRRGCWPSQLQMSSRRWWELGCHTSHCLIARCSGCRPIQDESRNKALMRSVAPIGMAPIGTNRKLPATLLSCESLRPLSPT
jgi:hypothetical protein